MSKKLDLPERVEWELASRKLFKRGERILVAVSGGVDSMALLHLLMRFSKSNFWKLSVCHFDHKLRGRSSAADETFVRKIAEASGLKYFSGKADVKAFAQRNKLSLEMAARKLRHDFLAATALKARVKKIAVAHHADDQAELFLLRLVRGSGSEGLAGMKWRSPSPSDRTVTLARPLLAESKRNLLEYASQNGILFREDVTNASPDILRNKIRHELLPLLETEYQPGLREILARQANLFGAEAEFMTMAAKDWLNERSDSNFKDTPVALQRKIIQVQLIQHELKPAFDLIEKLRLSSHQFITIASTIQLSCNDEGRLILKKLKPRAAFNHESTEFEFSRFKGAILFGNIRVQWKRKSLVHGTFHARKRTVNCENFDADKLGGSVVLRHWQPGDRFQPLGMVTPVKIQDLLVNRKVPRAERHKLLVGACGGKIFWVEGLPPGEQFKINASSRYRLQWCWNRL